MSRNKQLSPEEFEHAARTLRRSMSATNLAIARAVLVDGARQVDIAAESGQTAQAINNIIRRLWKVHVENMVPPEGWERIVVCLPKELALAVKQMELGAIERHKSSGDDVRKTTVD
jgi:hypothetical protein